MLVKATKPFVTPGFNAMPGEVFEIEGEILRDLLSAGLVEKIEESKSKKKAPKKDVKK